MIKKIAALAVLIILLPGSGRTQSASLSPDEKTLTNANFLIRVLDSINNLALNPSKIRKRDKARLNLKKRKTFKYGVYSISNYGVEIPGKNIGAGIVVMLKSGVPFLVSGRVSFHDASLNKCDSSILKMLYKANTDLSFLEKDCCVACFFVFENLDGDEYKFLSSLVPDSLVDDLVSQYIMVAPLWEILTEQFDFYDDSKIAAQFYDPKLSIMKKLFPLRNFEAMRKLMFTQNKIFNWFVAESLLYFNKQESFLTQEDLRIIDSFNGKNGYTKFRTYETLKRIYNEI